MKEGGVMTASHTILLVFRLLLSLSASLKTFKCSKSEPCAALRHFIS